MVKFAPLIVSIVASLAVALAVIDEPSSTALFPALDEDVKFTLSTNFTSIQDTLPGLKDFGFVESDILMRDNIVLKSLYFDPAPTSANGKNPAVIFISSWGMNKWEYVVPGKDLADRGYTVISYTVRGFWGSGGEIQMANRVDMADLSQVIDWMLANTNADPDRIGLSGISYGAGVSLLGSGYDKRVKSIAAMSGWVDLVESFLGQGETIRREGAKMLQVLGELTGNMGDELDQMMKDYLKNENLEHMKSFVQESCAVNFIDDINNNGASIFIANGFGDSLFTPNQFPAFYDKLVAPKHIEFAPGDHAGPELTGLFGLPNAVWSRASDWLDYYVKEGKTGPHPTLAAVTLSVLGSRDVEAYTSWKAVSPSTKRFSLGKREALDSMRGTESDQLQVLSEMRNRVSSGNLTRNEELSHALTGAGAHIQGGLAFITSTVRGLIDVPRHYIMPLVDRIRAGVWVSDRFEKTQRIRGVAHMSLNIVPESASGGLIVYLLDVDNVDRGALFTFAPITFKNLVPGKVQTLEFDLTMAAYDIAPGKRLGVVVSTHDFLYLDQNPKGETIQFMDGSVLTLPIN